MSHVKRNANGVPFDDVLVRGCIVSVRISGRADVLIGEVARSMCHVSRTAAVWPFGWDDPIVVHVAEIETVVIVELTRAELREVRARQRGRS